MKAMILNGSPRKNGHTAALLGKVREGVIPRNVVEQENDVIIERSGAIPAAVCVLKGLSRRLARQWACRNNQIDHKISFF